MRYFNYDDNEDFQEEVDYFFDEGHEFDDGEFDEGDFQGKEYIEMAHVDFVSDPKPQILDQAVKLLKQSWFWKFRSHEYKMKKVAETYALLSYLLYGSDEPEEE